MANALPHHLSRIISVFLGIVSTVSLCDTAVDGADVTIGSSRFSARSIDDVDHGDWDALLKRYVDSKGRVDYRGWLANRADRKRLLQYLAELSNVDDSVAASKSSRLSFWINAYNAVTIEGILREYPTSSIRSHTAKLFGYNIWHDLKLYVGGNARSLDEIEHKILRPMGEPRIHFAIVCASVGCPRLLDEAYVAEKVEQQLDRNARDFFDNPIHFRASESGNDYQLSSILDWFGEDFGESDSRLLVKVAGWLPDETLRKQMLSAAHRGSFSIRYLEYDWSLNQQPAP